LLARKYTLKRNVVKAGDRPASAGTTEGGQIMEKANTDQKLENGMPDASSASNDDSTAKSEEAN
jgi:hypothetical protein